MNDLKNLEASDEAIRTLGGMCQDITDAVAWLRKEVGEQLSALHGVIDKQEARIQELETALKQANLVNAAHWKDNL